MVAVRVDGVLKAGDDLVGRRRHLGRAAGARSEATRIGSTRSPAAASTPASAVPLVSWRFSPLGSLPGLGSRSRSTAS